MLAWFVALALVGAVAPAPSGTTSPLNITVHLIRRCQPDKRCLPSAIVRRMKDETAEIWSSLDVQIAWVDSLDARGAARAVDLRVMLEESAELGAAWRPHRGFLLAAVHRPDAPCESALARVWVTQARRHAASIRLQGIPFATLPDALADLVLARALGRALAHEIGHYLLGTAQHASYGLMRASFEPQELLEPATGSRYGLDPVDRAALNACGPDRIALR